MPTWLRFQNMANQRPLLPVMDRRRNRSALGIGALGEKFEVASTASHAESRHLSNYHLQPRPDHGLKDKLNAKYW